MYGWLFRHLPGPLWLRIIETVILVLVVLALLVTWVFPWLSQYNPFSDSTIGSLGSPAAVIDRH
ncbi:hypothetical protein [Psychromicrobium xiongbiense]|uniref:hypothetical protein n=1 Tax=Psychromicrobium xiongbiense TaxID=3051184 RepID=UPI0025540046|nr:hypothetical protein [Psychromicrobium sp. YIM S02556]